MTPTKEQFAAICYLVLMDHHGAGYDHAHPSYAAEKWDVMAGAGYMTAFGLLDSFNQGQVLGHLKKWGYEPPEEIKSYVNDAYGNNYYGDIQSTDT